MKAMILAAGRGERMKPLTDHCPKPLLRVKGVPLIEYHIKKLAQSGIKDIIINHAWLGQQIEDYLADGSQWQVNIKYSAESEALETAGGIIKALPLLGNEPFLIVNGDVFTDFNFNELPILAANTLAHLWLVKNPSHHLKGDFVIKNGLLQNIAMNVNGETSQKSYTYSGIAMFKASFFQDKLNRDDSANVLLSLAPLLRASAARGEITASILSASWTDVGTPERLAQLNLSHQ